MFAGEVSPAVGSSDATYVTLDAVQPMAVAPQPAQVATNGVRRVGALNSPTARIDGHGGKVDADIAILDTGVDRHHPDLYVVGGVNCVGGPKDAFDDDNGHGTMVAGVAAARDNKIGVVGVAPGARIWAVKVADQNGAFNDASVACGLEWILKHRPVIDVVNISLDFPGALGKCPISKADPIHLAVCKLVAQGTTVVASAGNTASDATGLGFASYKEVITVSAFTDTDGLPGRKGPAPACPLPNGATEKDDTFAFFSNYGPTVDITAPGVCVATTFPGGQYAAGSGTSFSAPHVAGAAALVRAKHPWWGTALVRKTILDAATPGPIRQDPDKFAEPILDVSGF